MGVTGLWQIVQPCARPIKIETLNRRRLAVDASIWIYQFLKAVRDKEGNALRNSHVVGFFRRICKLLFFGIKPVFVFDGGAPALKRATISARKSRREGRREDAVRTAGKLLAVQMQRAAEREEERRKVSARQGTDDEEEEVPDVENGKSAYVDEVFMTDKERRANRKFKKTDAYHLPELDVSLSEMGGAADPRIMSLEELESYARQFETGEDINVYDFSKIDYDGPFFMSLPASDRYNILNAARLRSRLRMGHSKEQLDSMFPDRMAFSKFQIERVRERNELTQRLMNLNGYQDGPDFGGGRVAGEKGREYVLVKNDGVEGGWALGVISDEGKQEKPIDVDKPAPAIQIDPEEEWEEDDDFEDVPIEGLNRLPKQRKPTASADDPLTQRRQNLYRSRRQAAKRRPNRKETQDPNSLFVQSDDDAGEDWEEVDANDDEIDVNGQSAEDEELQRAIAMSLEKEGVSEESPKHDASDEDDDMLEVFRQSAVAEQQPLPKGSGRAIANIVNKRAFNVAPESREVTSFGVPTMKPDDTDGEDDSIDFQAALAESRRTKRKTAPPPRPNAPAPKPKTDTARELSKKAGFSGPLPFESLDLGSSLLGKKKMQQRTEDTSGGFENPEIAAKPSKKQAEPLPPWFAGDLEKDIKAQKAIEDEDRERTREFNKQFNFQERGAALKRHQTDEVIDLDGDDNNSGFKHGEVIDLEADNDNLVDKELLIAPPIDDKIRMGDMADKVRAEPPAAEDIGEMRQKAGEKSPVVQRRSLSPDHSGMPTSMPDHRIAEKDDMNPAIPTEAEETLEWSESDDEEQQPSDQANAPIQVTNADATDVQRSRSPSEEFEDVTIPDAPAERLPSPTPGPDLDVDGPLPASGLAPQDIDPTEFDDFSDPEEEEMLRALTLETEEHARFASSLNNKSQAQNIEEYEHELKKLRTQQKKDRRDADEVTHIMITECQQLLRLFGLPYITAPMEAEAQCAELVNLGLVDGIVTDDSDCFLFGGTRIYKNMFNQAKFVECYLTSDLEKEFALTRDKLISVAQLLGSDYTEGLPGVGPVTALEILAEFPSLVEFRDWWSGVQTNAITKDADAPHAFRKKFRRSNSTRLFLPSSFPDARVQLAYENPEVDRDPQPFQWGVPDLAALRSFLMATIGWSEERTDEVLVPVIRDMNRRLDEGTQANITAFFDGGIGVGAREGVKGDAFAPRKKAAGSKRMGSALSRLAERARGEEAEAEEDDGEGAGKDETNKGRGSKRRRTEKRKGDGAEEEEGEERTADDGDSEETRNGRGKRKKTRPAKAGRRSRKTALDDDE